MPRDIQRRLEALERTAYPPAPDRAGELATAAETFACTFDAYVQRLEGRDPGPGASEMEQIACQAWADPEGARARLTARADALRLALEQDPSYRRWRDGTA